MKHNRFAGRGGCPVPMWSRGRVRWAVAVAVAVLLVSLLSGPASAQGSSDANLSSLTVSPKDIIGFSGRRATPPGTSVTSYAVGVASTVSQATITAVAADSGAVVVFDPVDADTAAGYQVNLSAGINTVTITVTAEASNTKAYSVTIGRGVTADYDWKASDDLDGLAAAEVTGPRGIWGNDTTIWVVDASQPDRHAVAFNRDGSRDSAKDINLRQISSGYDSPYGMWSDGETVWVANARGNDYANDFALVAYRLSGGDRLPSRDIRFTAEGWTGVWSDGRTIWVADSVDDKLFAYRLSDGARQAGSDFALHSDNASPGGIWSDGVTMWVTDQIDDKVYAYDRDSRNRVRGRDFDTATGAGQEALTGIWSDGVTMWIVEAVDTKVYSYNMATSNNADLRTLAVDGAEVAGFAYNTTSYSSDVADGAVREVTVTAQVRQSAARITSITPTDADPVASGHQVEFDDTTPVPVVVTVTAQNGTTKAYTLTLRNSSVSEVPVFGHQIGSLSASVDENTAAGTNIVEVSATDPEGAAVTFTLDDDGSRVFEIVPKSGSTTAAYIRTKASLDYETESTYAVVVVAADPGGNAASDAVTINVNNVQEPGRVRVSPTRVEFGVALTAALSDPDGGVRNVSWQWSRRRTLSDQWSSISGATSAAYTPVQADVGMYLRAVATYTDRLDAGRSAAVTLSPVLGCDATLGFGRLALVGTACVILDTAVVVVADGYDVATAARELERLAGWSVRSQLPGLGMIIAEYSPDNLTLAQLDAKRNQIAAYPWAARAERDAVARSTAGGAPTISGTAQVGRALTAVAAQSLDPSPPARPAKPTASTVAHDSVTIEWDDPEDASITGYRILRREPAVHDPGEFEVIVDDTGTADTSYTDTTVAASTQYVYRVKAINADGLSPESSYANAETPAPPPARPAKPTASTVAHDAVTIEWDDPEDASITGYRILRREPAVHDPGEFEVIVDDTGTADTSYTDTTVAASTQYVYRVKAINADGLSPESSYANAETPAPPVLGTPPI